MLFWLFCLSHYIITTQVMLCSLVVWVKSVIFYIVCLYLDRIFVLEDLIELKTSSKDRFRFEVDYVVLMS